MTIRITLAVALGCTALAFAAIEALGQTVPPTSVTVFPGAYLVVKECPAATDLPCKLHERPENDLVRCEAVRAGLMAGNLADQVAVALKVDSGTQVAMYCRSQSYDFVVP